MLVIGGLTGHVKLANADDVDCSKVKCVALTFDDGPSPYTDRLLQILNQNDAKATFFLIGNKVAANPDGARRIVDAGMDFVVAETFSSAAAARVTVMSEVGAVLRATE